MDSVLRVSREFYLCPVGLVNQWPCKHPVVTIVLAPRQSLKCTWLTKNAVCVGVQPHIAPLLILPNFISAQVPLGACSRVKATVTCWWPLSLETKWGRILSLWRWQLAQVLSQPLTRELQGWISYTSAFCSVALTFVWQRLGPPSLYLVRKFTFSLLT